MISSPHDTVHRSSSNNLGCMAALWWYDQRKFPCMQPWMDYSPNSGFSETWCMQLGEFHATSTSTKEVSWIMSGGSMDRQALQLPFEDYVVLQSGCSSGCLKVSCQCLSPIQFNGFVSESTAFTSSWSSDLSDVMLSMVIRHSMTKFQKRWCSVTRWWKALDSNSMRVKVEMEVWIKSFGFEWVVRRAN